MATPPNHVRVFMKRRPNPLLPLFPLGQIVATPAALRLLQELAVDPLDLLTRHARGDWGTLDVDDIQANEQALAHGSRIMSVYRFPWIPGCSTPGIQTIWLITEADRSSTCALLPEDY